MANQELREDGTIELREDGGIELREDAIATLFIRIVHVPAQSRIVETTDDAA